MHPSNGAPPYFSTACISSPAVLSENFLENLLTAGRRRRRRKPTKSITTMLVFSA